ncbi:ATP-dependent DNA ligase [Paenibacillus alvei]|uniref:ATP-dependent DNA ligase n=1 Tax=Paenibacillus alvei TaxID=44250 RepID=A0ABT4H344_PAEAL|nr:ATP-dependent DNA ligase [Paenibacillus alvei]MCY9763198.1 ATP-dependent DNA ligase [Paenibacillus alvei]MCY9769513.1 ATP-dependent DNA ligase [Paenibacillus alvei]
MFISPMLLETSNTAFNDPNYLFEPKFDGHRLIYSHINGTTRLYTRHNNECTKAYPEIAAVPFSDDIILDGEVVVIDPYTGTVDFESVMSRFQASRDLTIKKLSKQFPVSFVVFDILRYKGQDLRGLPLMERKKILQSIDFQGNKHIVPTPYIEGAGEVLFADICSKKMEGIVCKKKDSVYVSRRSEAWKKVINWTYVDVKIMGFRKGEFGWLAAIEDGEGNLRAAGMIELGVNSEQKKEFNKQKNQLIHREEKNIVYLQPLIRAKVKIRNFTKAGMLRDPAFVKFIS